MFSIYFILTRNTKVQVERIGVGKISKFNFGNLRLRARKSCRWKRLAWKSGEEYGPEPQTVAKSQECLR